MTNPFTQFTPPDNVFDLTFLLVGNSGSGKTDFISKYTKGPVHFYMADKGGEKTIIKNMRKEKRNNISVDILSGNDITFSDIWAKYQQDELNGKFEWLAKNNGIFCPDSLTSLNEKSIKEILKKDGKTPSGIGKKLDNKLGMSQPHWGQLLNWMQTFVETLQDLPCAVAIPVHLHVMMNKKQEVVARYPMVNGQFRQCLSKDFDETYLLEMKQATQIMHFKERLKFEAKSRSFSMDKKKNPKMDDLVTAYLAGKDTF
jgi:hypothetical protein